MSATPARDGMNGPALVAARQRLDLTPDRMAAELGLPPHAYRACEEGRATLPRRAASQLAFRVATAEREAALEASGLPECAWLADWERGMPSSSRAFAAHLRRGEAHATACPTCQARERFVRERFPEMPEYPQPAWMRAFRAVQARVAVLPAWLQPAAWGALLLAAIVSVRVLLVLPAATSRPALLATALGALLAAAAAGAIGGLIYGVLGRPLRRVPLAGPYLAGIVAVLGYVVAIVGLMTVRDDGPDAFRPGAFALGYGLVFSLVGGAFLGHAFLREPDASDEDDEAAAR